MQVMNPELQAACAEHEHAQERAEWEAHCRLVAQERAEGRRSVWPGDKRLCRDGP